MNWAIKIISKTLMTKILHILWGGYDKGGYDKGFYGILIKICKLYLYSNLRNFIERCHNVLISKLKLCKKLCILSSILSLYSIKLILTKKYLKLYCWNLYNFCKGRSDY